MISRLLILVIGICLMIGFQIVKFFLNKYAKSFNDKAKAYYPWLIFGCVFIALYITYAVKFKNYLPFDSAIDSLSITAIAVFGYDLIEPFIKKIFNK